VTLDIHLRKVVEGLLEVFEVYWRQSIKKRTIPRSLNRIDHAKMIEDERGHVRFHLVTEEKRVG